MLFGNGVHTFTLFFCLSYLPAPEPRDVVLSYVVADWLWDGEYLGVLEYNIYSEYGYIIFRGQPFPPLRCISIPKNEEIMLNYM